jgi:hypothetical protein
MNGQDSHSFEDLTEQGSSPIRYRILTHRISTMNVNEWIPQGLTHFTLPIHNGPRARVTKRMGNSNHRKDV